MKVYLICFICFELAYGRTTPDYIPQCKRNDPQIEECILEGVESLRPRLKDGIPEINLPPLEPFMMALLHVNTSLTGIKLKATVTNIVAHGGSNFKIEHLKVDLDNKYAAELKLSFPRLDVAADYNTQGSRVLLFHLTGRGKFKGSFSNLVVEADCTASPVEIKGVEYLRLDSVTTKVSVGSAEIEINPAELTFTGRAARSFISSSPSLILNILSPAIDESTAPIVKQYLDDVLASVPIRDVLTDS